MDTDGTGATLAWPLIVSAAALLSEVAEGEDPGPTLPNDMTTMASLPTAQETPGDAGLVHAERSTTDELSSSLHAADEDTPKNTELKTSETSVV